MIIFYYYCLLHLEVIFVALMHKMEITFPTSKAKNEFSLFMNVTQSPLGLRSRSPVWID